MALYALDKASLKCEKETHYNAFDFPTAHSRDPSTLIDRPLQDRFEGLSRSFCS